MAFARATLTAGAALAVTLAPAALAGAASAAPSRLAAAPVISRAAADPLLEVGSQGPAVKAWQQDLNTFRTTLRSPAAGRIAADGVYGPNTAEATRDFQRYYRGVGADGVVGPVTRARMQESLDGADAGSAGTGTATATPPGSGTASAGLSSAVLRQGARGSRVTSWQQRLDLYREQVRSPHLPGIATDGVYGPVTTAATRDLQRQAGITEDGVFGPQTLQAYERLAG